MNSTGLTRLLGSPVSANPGDLPESFRRSLRYFNLYRLLVAILFLVAVLYYGAESAFGVSDHASFSRLAVAYLLFGGLMFVLPRRLERQFNLALSVGVIGDIVLLSLMMHYSGGVRSGLGYMLLVVLAGGGLVGQGRLTLFHAALASLALLTEHAWRVLGGAGELAEFFHAGIMSLGFFGSAITARLLASRVVANEALARRQGLELEAQQHINQRVIRDMQDGVIVADRHGEVRQYNPQAAALFGLSGAGRSLVQFSAALAERFRVWSEGGHEVSELLRATEGQRLLRVRYLPPGERGNALLYIEDMARVQAQAQQIKLAALGRLAANMAHEIRNPLASISHAAELLGEEQADPMQVRLTRIIGDNTRRLDRIVNEVLELGRRDRAAPEVIRLAEFVDGLLEELILNRPHMYDTVRTSIPADLRMSFDRGHLYRILSNLLMNAQRYCTGRPGAIRLQAAVREGGRVEIHVTDDGPGISDTLRSEIFEPFFTTHAGGTGLGLYIARELCEANGAFLELQDDQPGAHFCIIAQGVS